MTDVIRIDDVFYSTEKLAAMHPGGPIFVEQFNNRDGTALYNFSHRRRFDHDKYARMRVNPTDVSKAFDTKTSSSVPDFTLYWEICEKVKPYVAATNGFAPTYLLWLKPTFIFTLFLGLNFSYFLNEPRWDVWMVVYAVLGAILALAVQHDANHGAWSRNWKVNRLLGLGQCLIGASAVLWMNEHATHHVACNDVERDPDVNVPFSRFHEKFPKKFWHAMQHIYIFVLLMFYGPLKVATDLVKLTLGPVHAGLSRRIMGDWTLDTVVVLLTLFRYVAMVIQFPSWSTVAWVFVVHCIAGFYLAFFFLLSHNFEGVKKAGADASTGCFVKHQVETSSNVGGAILGFVNGGLNYQIEHHLFPRVHHSYYPTIAPIVRAVCLKHGIQYVHFDTVLDNLRSTVAHLHQLGCGSLVL